MLKGACHVSETAGFSKYKWKSEENELIKKIP